uniref:Cleavage and polyadenylation specificity factor subunit 4 n=1 Tax=Acrobeloides nanus TaxID=290746 RepID=A0A914D9E7_9BILA
MQMHLLLNNDDFIPLTMDMLLSDVKYPVTDVEQMVKEQRGMREAPFPGMDKTGRGVCIKFEQGTCSLGVYCPLRHLVGDKSVVCKHWLRGLCKKGDGCEFLHEYDLSKMPECFFFSKYQACSNRECPFRHVDPESKILDCAWYDRGFCIHGPYCKNRHRRRVACPLYMAGFCPDGKRCKYAHPSFKIPTMGAMSAMQRNFNTGFGICNNCHERGHKATFCPYLPTKMNLSQVEQPKTQITQPIQPQEKKSLSEVTCFKCGEKGHYANRCHKGVLAFLANKTNLPGRGDNENYGEDDY